MKKFLSIGLAGILLLGTNSIVYANESSINRKVETRTYTHNLSNHKISGNGFVNQKVEIYCDYGTGIHNRAKIHYYNRSSEPVTVQCNSRSMTVEAWSGNSFELYLNPGSIYITVRGLNDNTNQVINGELSVKSWYK